MYVLRIEHPVPNFDGWKHAFDGDPVDRKGAGVKRHRILRATDEPNHVLVDLEFDTLAQAEAMLASLRVVWARVKGAIMTNPRVRILEVVESKEY